MQKKLSKSITAASKSKPKQRTGDEPNQTTSKKLKINYPDRRRIPEESTEALAEKEKEAQKEANQSPLRRHKMQSFEIDPVEFPEWNWLEDIELNDPLYRHIRGNPLELLNLDVYKLRGIDFPKLKKQLLNALKLKLNDLHDFSLRNFDFELPRLRFGKDGETLEGKTTRRKEKKDIWKYGSIDIYREYPLGSISGSVWSGAALKIVDGTIVRYFFSITAEHDSAIATDYILLPFSLDDTSYLQYEVLRCAAYTQSGYIHRHLFPPEYDVAPTEWWEYNTSRPSHKYRPKAYPTDIKASVVNNQLKIEESFMSTTSATECGHRRAITGTIIVAGDAPEYMDW